MTELGRGLGAKGIRPTRTPAAYVAGLLALIGAYYFGGGVYMLAKAQVAQFLLQHAWQKTLRTGSNTAPWPWADSHPVAELQVPKLGIGHIVLAGASGRNLAFAPSHVSGTARPGTSGAGISIIAGHRDTHFSFLGELTRGDQVRIRPATGLTMNYLVQHSEVMDTRSQQLDPGLPDPYLVLVTCYPFTALSSRGPLRYLVYLQPDAP